MGCSLERAVTHSTKPSFKSHPKNKSPTIMANIIHTCHVEFHIDFSSTENVQVVVQNYPRVNLKRGRMTPSINENLKILQNLGLIIFM